MHTGSITAFKSLLYLNSFFQAAECFTTCWFCKVSLHTETSGGLKLTCLHSATELKTHLEPDFLKNASLLLLFLLTHAHTHYSLLNCSYHSLCFKLTSPSSPGSAEVRAKSFPLESKALISMPQLVSGCRSHTLNTCLTSILCQELTPAFTSIFRERIRMCRFPSATGIRREICRNTVVASSAGRKCTQSCARTMRLAWNFWVKEKKQHLGSASTWTMGSAGEEQRDSVYWACVVGIYTEK